MILHIPLFEYQEMKYSDIKIPEGAQNPFLDDAFIDGLEKYLKKLNLDTALTFTRTGIVPSSQVGVIKYKNIQFEILPKVLARKLSQDVDREQTLKNLIYMLSYTKRLNIKNPGTAALSTCPNPFLETLIRMYAETLFDAIKRYTPKGYIVCSENVRFLKGRLNLSAHIKYNSINQSKFFCDYDEFSENNALNQMFLYVATCLHNISRHAQNKKLLKFIMNYYSDIDLVHIYPKDLDRIKLNRNQIIFDMPFRLAKMFIEKTSVDITQNKFDNVAMIWDMNVLFEEFVAEFIKRNKTELNIKEVVYQHRHKLLKSDENDRCYSNTFVDIYIITENGDNFVLDTKYKNNYGRRGEFSNPDVFQVTTYCRLHNSRDAILLYPATDSNTDDIHPYKLNVDENVDDLTIKTARLDIRTDLSKAHSALINRLKQIFKV